MPAQKVSILRCGVHLIQIRYTIAWGPLHPSCVVNHMHGPVLCPPTQGICEWVEHSLSERCRDSCQDAEGFQLLLMLVGREEMQNLI